MTITRIIRAADCCEVPWKNGGGTTREIAVFPPGADMDTFLWRLSMARVEQAGPFSAFAGIDRVLTVIQGTLALGGSVSVRLDETTAPFAFDGSAAVHGAPVDGPVLDVNAMARRGAYAVTVDRLDAGDCADCPSTASAFIIALEPQQLETAALGPLDCVGFKGRVTLQGKALAILFRRS